eukprot:2437829-Alexandrium_andersonii.AAC.1
MGCAMFGSGCFASRVELQVPRGISRSALWPTLSGLSVPRMNRAAPIPHYRQQAEQRGGTARAVKRVRGLACASARE